MEGFLFDRDGVTWMGAKDFGTPHFPRVPTDHDPCLNLGFTRCKPKPVPH